MIATSSLGIAASCASVLGADFDHAIGDAADGSTLTSASGDDAGTHTVTLADGATVTVDRDGAVVTTPPGSDGDDDASATSGGGDDDGAVDVMPTDASASGPCTRAPETGDLTIVELMIGSTSTDDQGEYIEFRNVSSCTLSLQNLLIYSPNGGKSNADSVWISTPDTVPPGGRFLVADSDEPAVNNDLPGLLYSFESAGTLDAEDDIYIDRSPDGGMFPTNHLFAYEYDFNWCQQDPAVPCWDIGHSMTFSDSCASGVNQENDRTGWLEADAGPYFSNGGVQLYGTPNAANPGACKHYATP